MVAGEDEAGDARRGVDRHRDRTHARAECRGEEAAVLRADKRAAGDRLAGGDRKANHRPEKRLGIALGRALDIIGALHELLGPGLIGKAFSVDDRADRKSLLGDQHLGPKRNGGCGGSLLSSSPCEHILGHDGGNHRDDQCSNEQSELLHIHGVIASP